MSWEELRTIEEPLHALFPEKATVDHGTEAT
jgi:hypothetical protein